VGIFFHKNNYVIVISVPLNYNLSMLCDYQHLSQYMMVILML